MRLGGRFHGGRFSAGRFDAGRFSGRPTVQAIAPLYVTNLPGAGIEIDALAETVTIAAAGADNGVYPYNPATLAAGLPQWLRDPTVTEDPSDTFTLNDDGIYLAPSDDLPSIIGKIYRGVTFVENNAEYTLTSPDDDGVEVSMRALLMNGATTEGSEPYAAILLQAGVVNTPAAYITNTSPSSQTYSAGTYTHSGVAIGAAAADRRVTVFIATLGAGGQAGRPTAVTIGGVSAVERESGIANVGASSFTAWDAVVPTGSTADIAVTRGTLWFDASVIVFISNNSVLHDSGSSSGAASTSQAANLDIAAGGALITCAFSWNGTSLSLTGSTAAFAQTDFNTSEFVRGGLDTGLSAETNRAVSASESVAGLALYIISLSYKDAG